VANVAQFVSAWYESHKIQELEGQGLVEYGLIIVFIAVVCVAAVTALGGTVNGIFEDINGKLG
jgi:pilus assembly protein Flp/PilA